MNHRLILAFVCGLLGGVLLTAGAAAIHPGLAVMVAGVLLLGFALLAIDVSPRRPRRDGVTLRRSDR